MLSRHFIIIIIITVIVVVIANSYFLLASRSRKRNPSSLAIHCTDLLSTIPLKRKLGELSIDLALARCTKQKNLKKKFIKKPTTEQDTSRIVRSFVRSFVYKRHQSTLYLTRKSTRSFTRIYSNTPGMKYLDTGTLHFSIRRKYSRNIKMKIFNH